MRPSHHLEPAVHVAFAERQLRIEHEVPLEPLVGDADDDRGGRGRRRSDVRAAARIDEGQRAAPDDAAQAGCRAT